MAASMLDSSNLRPEILILILLGKNGVLLGNVLVGRCMAVDREFAYILFLYI